MFKNGNIYFPDFPVLPQTQNRRTTEEMKIFTDDLERLNIDKVIPDSLIHMTEADAFAAISLKNDSKNIFDVLGVDKKRYSENIERAKQYME